MCRDFRRAAAARIGGKPTCLLKPGYMHYRINDEIKPVRVSVRYTKPQGIVQAYFLRARALGR
jgi:hypothetical protein